MKTTSLALATVLLLACHTANAQLRIYSDYMLSDEVWHISTIRVHSGAGDDYLEGLSQTWIAANEVAKELGHIEDYFIYVSDLPRSGDFNMLLVVRLADSAALAPSRQRYDAFMEAWGEANQERTREVAKDYPSMREITGEYNMRRLELIKK